MGLAIKIAISIITGGVPQPYVAPTPCSVTFGGDTVTFNTDTDVTLGVCSGG